MTSSDISTTLQEKIPGKYWRLAVVAGMASYLDAGVIVSGGLSLATWQKSFGLDPWALGIISAVLTFSIAVGALFGGRIADVFGRRRVFNIDILVYVVGTILIVTAPSPGFIIAGAAIAGLAAGADLPTSVAVVSELAPRGAQGRLVAFTQVMWSIGIGVTTAIGFAISSLGLLGVQILYAHLAIVALVTWAIRVFSKSFRSMEAQASATETSTASAAAYPLKKLLSSRTFLASLALTAAFYIAWNFLANTLGQFKAFFLVTVSGVDQSTATGLIFLTTLLSIVGGLIFVRIADTKLRRTMFYVGAGMQVVAMLIGAVFGGTVFIAMVGLLVFFNLFYPFAGEALYKVWTQESFPVNARATAQGFTYALSRFAVAGFALVTPAILAASPSALLWMLVAFAVLSGFVGSFLIRRPKWVPDAGTPGHQDAPKATTESVGAGN